jgi:hypothetical protein
MAEGKIIIQHLFADHKAIENGALVRFQAHSDMGRMKNVLIVLFYHLKPP